MIRLNILPECYVDTQVAKIIVQAKLNHQMGCNQVANKLLGEFKESIALGIIDEDKNKGSVHPYIKQFDTRLSLEGLQLKKHKQKEHYLIVICPEIENWLLTDARSANINISKFDLPSDLKGLKAISKTQDISKNINFHRFIKALIKSEAPSITRLQSWLELFKNGRLSTLIN
jgi:hypothetical protein